MPGVSYLVQEKALSFGEYPVNEITVVKVRAIDECPESAVRECSLVHECPANSSLSDSIPISCSIRVRTRSGSLDLECALTLGGRSA